MAINKQRLARAEGAIKAARQSFKGYKHFVTYDEVSFYDTTSPDGKFSHEHAVMGMGGPELLPEDLKPVTRAHLDALEAEGWQVMVIQYVEEWRN